MQTMIETILQRRELALTVLAFVFAITGYSQPVAAVEVAALASQDAPQLTSSDADSFGACDDSWSTCCTRDGGYLASCSSDYNTCFSQADSNFVDCANSDPTYEDCVYQCQNDLASCVDNNNSCVASAQAYADTCDGTWASCCGSEGYPPGDCMDGNCVSQYSWASYMQNEDGCPFGLPASKVR